MKQILGLSTLCVALILAICLLGGCTGENAFLKVKDSSFCSSIPSNSYSIICEVTDHFGTTPEAVRITMKLANLAGVDQWYTARAADAFLEDLEVHVVAFQIEGVADWGAFASYALARYNGLNPKIRAVFVIAKDLFEFNPPSLTGRPLSELDYQRIRGNIIEQRAIIAPFLESN